MCIGLNLDAHQPSVLQRGHSARQQLDDQSQHDYESDCSRHNDFSPRHHYRCRSSDLFSVAVSNPVTMWIFWTWLTFDQQTIFGCSFFSADADNNVIAVTSDFWIFWSATLPATVAVLLLYGWWSRRGQWKVGKYRHHSHLHGGKR